MLIDGAFCWGAVLVSGSVVLVFGQGCSGSIYIRAFSYLFSKKIYDDNMLQKVFV
jgi:hypothetical protein